MIIFKRGNIFDEEVEAIVNTVNCVGVMGKGIALQFKNRYPDNFKEYKKLCGKNRVKIGSMFVFTYEPNHYIINFPTKTSWRLKSKYSYISEGLDDLIKVINKYNIESIAIPTLGCGNGGLSWKTVKKIIITKLNRLDTKIIVFEG